MLRTATGLLTRDMTKGLEKGGGLKGYLEEKDLDKSPRSLIASSPSSRQRVKKGASVGDVTEEMYHRYHSENFVCKSRRGGDDHESLSGYRRAQPFRRGGMGKVRTETSGTRRTFMVHSRPKSRKHIRPGGGSYVKPVHTSTRRYR